MYYDLFNGDEIMRIAVIADIHGNSDALQAVLKDIKKEKIQEIYCCGNIIGYNADPRTCIKLVQNNRITCVQGDYDFVVVTLQNLERFTEPARAAIMWTYQLLWKKEKKFLGSLPIDLVEDNMTIMHGSPRAQFPGIDAADLKSMAKRVKTKMLFFGHTHIPFVKDVEGVLLVSPGSVGQPRDGDIRASYAIVNTETLTASIRRVPYNVNTAIEKIRQARLPESIAEMLRK